MINLTAEFVAKPGLEQELHALLTEMIKPTRSEQGCLSYRLLQDSNILGRFVFQEQFADQEAFDYHCQQPYFQNLISQLDAILNQEPVITFYQEIDI